MAIIRECIRLLYPHLCCACGSKLRLQEVDVCEACWQSLPRTGFHLQTTHALSRLFWGRVAVDAVYAMCYFDKSGKIRSILHSIKYAGGARLATHIGKRYGKDLLQIIPPSSIDYIVPIPLHPAKLKSRGFNQSEAFANGLGESMDIGVLCAEPRRVVHTQSQTRKSRMQRWENVATIFEVQTPALIAHKNILLVDDVLTTGATLEACAHCLLQNGAESVKIATIACALKI